MKNMKIDANGTEIRVMGDVVNEEAYISLTDIAKYKNPDNAFTLTPQQWIKATDAIGIVSKSGRYGGTYAHTDAVKEFLLTPTLSPQEMAYTYASEADILNMALFGKTAAQWRSEKGVKGKTPNIRDFASAEELVVLINLEDTNADLIRQDVPKIERLKILRKKAYRQIQILRKNQETIEALKQNLIEDTEKED